MSCITYNNVIYAERFLLYYLERHFYEDIANIFDRGRR
jgi:hypothetical protein